MLDKMMGEEMWLNADNICTFPKPWIEEDTEMFEGAKRGTVDVEAETVSPGEAARFVGNYSNPVYPVLMLKLEDSALKVRLLNI